MMIFLNINDNELELKRLLRKYGSLEGIEKNADIRDSMAYMMANQNGLAQKVLTQKTGNSLLSSQGTQYAKNDRANHAIDAQKRKGKLSSSFEKAKKIGLYKDDDKFNLLVNTVFNEEGGYEDSPKKIDQPTNMGIIQSTLSNFNKKHSDLQISSSLKELSSDEAKLIYKLDFYDHYHIESINDFDTSKVVMHMFVMLTPDSALNLLHQSLNDFGYPCKKLLTKEMIPMLNKISNNGKSKDFKDILKRNYTDFLRKSPDAKKYKGWFSRIERL